MQKLSQRRLTDTPTDIPHVRGTCGLLLNSPEGRDSVTGLSTCDNNPDAALTPANGGPKGSVLAYVVNRNGKPLMPCTPAKARHLLSEGRATVLTRPPFTIQLAWDCEHNVQPVIVGVDSGYLNVGLSAVSGKRELYSAEVRLRSDIVKLNSERKQYKRGRRYRHTWYRKPRFLNRRKPEGWIAPSLQNKVDAQVKLIDGIAAIVPVSEMIVEVAAFDMQKIRDPEISGTGYQNGPQAGFWNVREYVLYRDNHACVHCRGRSGEKRLNVHHLESRQTGGDRPDNLVTLCLTCHGEHHKDTIKLKAKPARGLRAEAFMTTSMLKKQDLSTAT